MRETANERLVREIAREVALEAIQRILARLREAEAEPLVERRYEAEWVMDGKKWPTLAMPAGMWVPYLRDDLERAQAEYAACRGRE